MKDNIYLKSLEIGYNNINGISFNQLKNILKEPKLENNDAFSFHFNTWFYENFYNKGTHEEVSYHKNFADVGRELEYSNLLKHNDELSFIKGSSISKYLEFIELKEARKSSNRAFIISMLSLLVACMSIIIPFIPKSNNKPLNNIKPSKERNCTTNCKFNNPNKSEFTIDSVIKK